MTNSATPSQPTVLSDAIAVAKDHLAAVAGDGANLVPMTGDEVDALFARYYRHVPEEDLNESTPTDLAGAVLSQVHLAGDREIGTDNVRVHNPTVAEHGWHTGHTVVEIVTGDKPFLVDSVTAELSRQGRPIHQILHPMVLVRRDETGKLLQVLGHLDPCGYETEHDPSWPEDARVESWMHFQIDLESDPKDRDECADNLLRVLNDVRAAVEDWRLMSGKAKEISQELRDNVPADVVEETDDAQRLLEWMSQGHFTFLGYRQYELSGAEGEEKLTAVKDSGLGILRGPSDDAKNSFNRSTPEVRAQARERNVLILTKANSRATVHRPVYLDYVGVKRFDAAGNVVGEDRFLGLLTAAAYTQSVFTVPLIDRKVNSVLERAGFAPGSHSDKDLRAQLENHPRDELLQMSTDELFDITMSVMHLRERRQTRTFLRRDRYGRFVSCLVFLPRDVYTTRVRLRMQQILTDHFQAQEVDYSTRLTESVLARLHFVVRVPRDEVIPEDMGTQALARRISEATESWEDQLAAELKHEVGEEEAGRILAGWETFPEAYKESYPGRLAASDLRAIQRLLDTPLEESMAAAPEAVAQGLPVGGLMMNLYQPLGRVSAKRQFKVYRTTPLTLTTVLPLFRNLGVDALDERPYELRRADGITIYIYDFSLQYTGNDMDGARGRFTEAFAAAWLERTETDGLDRLVLSAKLTWRQVVLLRAYTKYLRQIGTAFSQNYIESTLLEHSAITSALVELFEDRFDPDRDSEATPRDEAEAEVTARILRHLEGVRSLDSDRILRLYLSLIKATVRTNFYQVDASGQPKPYVSMKLLPHQVAGLPEPRPAFEIWVYSPRVEGVHLRFGEVARGGLRWSDRREDFRTEILGLVKAQVVKNAVIVPSGAKGGFFAKQLPDPSVDRDAWFNEGIEAYKTFISALLDVTDNLAPGDGDGGRLVVPPLRVVRHDADDPYLVVAADKGTASFSDIANGVSQEYGFWLGDAFASGGSVGYDHKAMGITARGAWESVKRHFREMGVDTQTEEFTTVGVGDMSGDVFGNGMLLSEHIRLVAAFNHLHIFVDPTPDAAASFAERSRLFDLPRSTWESYDTSLISQGGGVFSRDSKSIDITPQMREALGIAEDVTQMTPQELIKAILLAPVDLLWNGGIGTYVKAADESHAQVGDRANDGIRLNGAELRVKVVGEGGNLGLTQLGRIEAAQHGVRVNTDAIDNSAGVDCSDHEVNIKILLDQAIADGDLTQKQRNTKLADMTDEVARLVLRDNVEQNILLSNARYQAPIMLGVHHRFIKALERVGVLVRELEGLPSDVEIEDRLAAGQGLTSPEMSVLVAYAKIELQKELKGANLTAEPWFQTLLYDYFPTQLHDQFGDRFAAHQLAEEIVTTAITNELVNRGGITFAYRAMEETGATVEAMIRAYAVSRSVFGLPAFTTEVDGLPTSVSTTMQTKMYLEFRRLLDRSTRWMLTNLPGQLDVAETIAQFEPLVQKYQTRMDDLLVGSEREAMQARVEQTMSEGVPEGLARWHAGLLASYSLLDVHGLLQSQQVPEEYVTTLYFGVSERYSIDRLLDRVSNLTRENRWAALARGAVRDDLYAAMEGIAAAVLNTADTTQAVPGADQESVRTVTDGWVKDWEDRNAEQIQRVRATLRDADMTEEVNLATMSVVLRQIRALVKSGSGM